MTCFIGVVMGGIAGLVVGAVLAVVMISRMRRNWRRGACSRFSVER